MAKATRVDRVKLWEPPALPADIKPLEAITAVWKS